MSQQNSKRTWRERPIQIPPHQVALNPGSSLSIVQWTWLSYWLHFLLPGRLQPPKLNSINWLRLIQKFEPKQKEHYIAKLYFIPVQPNRNQSESISTLQIPYNMQLENFTTTTISFSTHYKKKKKNRKST